MPRNKLIIKYNSRKKEIEKRLSEFKKAVKMKDEDLYAEMVFCMLTPQSNAKRCWEAVEELKSKGLLLDGDKESISNILRKKVRFHNNKSDYIIKNREIFSNINMEIKNHIFGFADKKELRRWLVKNVKGYGMKEASHFIRNIGLGEDIAILDRHILKNLKRHGIIKEIPKSLTPKKYEEIENEMIKFCAKAGIPLPHLDLLFWSEETGEIFK